LFSDDALRVLLWMHLREAFRLPAATFASLRSAKIAADDLVTTRHIPWKEPSATIVWEELNKHQVADRTILFNAVPWHPEGKDGPLTNRAPNADEKKAGQACLSLFFELFPELPVMALGNIASQSLNRLSIEHTKIRHPANGGAPLFRAGADVFIQKCNKRKEHNRTL
jgi:hypothetical protein